MKEEITIPKRGLVSGGTSSAVGDLRRHALGWEGKVYV